MREYLNSGVVSHELNLKNLYKLYTLRTKLLTWSGIEDRYFITLKRVRVGNEGTYIHRVATRNETRLSHDLVFPTTMTSSQRG